MLIQSNNKPIKIIGAGLVADDLIEFLTNEGHAAIKTTLEEAQASHDCNEYQYLVGILGDIRLRDQAIKWIEKYQLHTPIYVHPSTVLYKDAVIGPGTVIYSLCVIQQCNIGSHCIISSFSMVSHGATIGDQVVMYPYACALGSSKIASGCLLQSRSTVNTHVEISAQHVNLLPLAFVTKNITVPGTYGGSSARMINSSTALEVS
jgi:UDP-3-O-[3-hydroxymyristoyl] glucosamine N-acyltransferase